MSKSKSRTGTKATAKTVEKYSYAELNKCSYVDDSTCNFYAVIVDATFPYQFVSKNGAKQFQCTIKIVDPSLSGKDNWAQLHMFASKFEDLPIVQRLGDVIRVHRAKSKRFGDRRQFSANLSYSSSWALYSTDNVTPLGQKDTGGPYAFSGKRSTQEKADGARQKALKTWA